MKKILLICTVVSLSGCAQVVASNEKQITITAPPVAAAEAFRLADEHCSKFQKVAVPTGTVYGQSTVFECQE